VRGALEKVDGVSKIDIKQDDMDFTVHYDPKKIKPADMVGKLVAAGEKDAKVKS
jgi:copper chaperone CopZ